MKGNKNVENRVVFHSSTSPETAQFDGVHKSSCIVNMSSSCSVSEF